MGKFPKFCDEAKDADDEAALINACKVELSALLAHIMHESEDLTKSEDEVCAASSAWECKNHKHS